MPQLKFTQKIFVFILFNLSVLLNSCYTPYNNLKSSVDFDKEINTGSLSLFGKLSYDNGSLKTKDKYLLLFKNDTLKYISIGKKLKKHSSVYKVIYQSDTLNILSSEFHGKYYTTDTSFFFTDEYFHKTVYYDHPRSELPKTSNPILADFYHYKFTTNECFRSNKRYYCYPNKITETTPLAEYSNQVRVGVAISSLTDTIVSWKYSDKKEELLNFSNERLR